MAYEKRVCVLKQIKKGFSADGGAMSGAVYAERLGETATVTPRIVNLAPLREGRYGLAVWIGGKIFCLELRANEQLKIEKAPSLGGGFSVLLCYLRNDAEPLAYGFCGTAPASYGALLNAFAAETQAGAKRQKKQQEEEKEESAPSFCPPESKYDDEAIAVADYFAVAGNEDENAAACRQEEEGAVAGGGDSCPHDESVHPIEFPRGSLTYYREVSERIEKAFRKFPHDDKLQEIFPQSEWVDSDGTRLGVIYEAGQPRYLCVAVEKTKDGVPAPMKEHAVFVPASPFTEEEGFFIVFQDADTGEYVTVSMS